MGALRHGNPIHDDTQMAPMIRDTDAARVSEWIQEAVDAGARVVAGGDREGPMYVEAALRFVKEVKSGNLHINSGPSFRADLMPYGGLKDSGMGNGRPELRRAVDDRAQAGGLPLVA